MPAFNTDRSYGSLARVLHWLTALLIFTALPLGFVANRTALVDDDAIARVFTLFSLHKTIGILALAVGILRIVWTIRQPRPAPLHPDRRLETLVATTVHWTLSLSLILVPLSGWLSHAATEGLAPIRWPFGQSIPFVPKNAGLAEITGGVHWVATKLLVLAILLHVVGALKHALIYRDGTLVRMLTGRPAPGADGRAGRIGPALLALTLWALALALGLSMGLDRANQLAAAPPPAWPIVSGNIEVLMEGRDTPIGQVAAWDANLALDPGAAAEQTGTLDLFAALDSLDGQDAPLLLDLLAIPILQFSGTVSGKAPLFGAAGTLDVGGLNEQADIAIARDQDGARIQALLPISGAPGFLLNLDLRAAAP